ncbi:MAG: class I SAM-dependent methyltransferase [Streptosporangiaceae bacterium]
MTGQERARRERLRATFEQVASSYHHARPEYPAELYDCLLATAGLSPGDTLLEVGCGTGKATLPLARMGFAITCLEPGALLAEQARRNLAGHPAVRVVQSSFEDWRPDDQTRSDLVFAATAWHWVDPAVRYRRAWEALRPAGHLAIWTATHVVPAEGDPFFAEIQEVYDEIGEGLPAGARFPAPGEVPDECADMAASGLFSVVAVRQFDWGVEYNADQYVSLLGTFSSHIDMAEWQRDRLYGEIRRRLASRPDGRLRRHWGAALQIAVRLRN